MRILINLNKGDKKMENKINEFITEVANNNETDSVIIESEYGVTASAFKRYQKQAQDLQWFFNSAMSHRKQEQIRNEHEYDIAVAEARV